MATTSNTSYKVTRNHLNNATSILVDEILIAAANINTTTDLSLVGKDTIGYGTAIAQNSIKLLENFASSTAPTKPTEGQIWWDTGATVTTAGTDKNSNKALMIWNITTPGGTGTASGEWITLHSLTEGTLDGVILIDNNSATHKVRVVTVGTTIVSITSKDATFVINTTDATMATYRAAFSDTGLGTGTATINTGINLNTLTTDSTRLMKFHGTATHAQYADVAEMYTADTEHASGTVVILSDSEHDVTDAKNELDSEVFGIVTTDPALLMNSMLQGTTVGVALLGRVPCNVTGIIKKGDRIISSNLPGHGQSVDAVNEYSWQHVIGRALESKTTLGPGTIEVIVGVK